MSCSGPKLIDEMTSALGGSSVRSNCGTQVKTAGETKINAPPGTEQLQIVTAFELFVDSSTKTKEQQTGRWSDETCWMT